MARGRLICHDGTLYEAPELPPGADERARHVRDSLVRYGYYRLPLWEREAKFGGMVACALLVWFVRRRGDPSSVDDGAPRIGTGGFRLVS